MHTRHKRLARHTILCGIVRLNIGGREYVTSKSTLQMDPEGMLATMISGRVPSAKINDAYFIDRDPDLFCYVLEFLRTGHVELPNSEGSWRRLEREADFFMLPSLQQLIRSKLLQAEDDGRRFNIMMTANMIHAEMLELRKENMMTANGSITMSLIICLAFWQTFPLLLATKPPSHLLELASLPISSPSFRVASRTPFYCIRDHVRAMVVEDIEHFQEDARSLGILHPLPWLLIGNMPSSTPRK